MGRGSGYRRSTSTAPFPRRRRAPVALVVFLIGCLYCSGVTAQVCADLRTSSASVCTAHACAERKAHTVVGRRARPSVGDCASFGATAKERCIVDAKITVLESRSRLTAGREDVRASRCVATCGNTGAMLLAPSTPLSTTCPISSGAGPVTFDCSAELYNLTRTPGAINCTTTGCTAQECCTIVPPAVAAAEFSQALHSAPPEAEWWTVSSSISFSVDISAVGAVGTTERSQFESGFKVAIAQSLGDGSTIDAEKVIIDSITAGSVVVDWHVQVPPAVATTAKSLVQSMKDSGQTVQVLVDGRVLAAPTASMAVPTTTPPPAAPEVVDARTPAGSATGAPLVPIVAGGGGAGLLLAALLLYWSRHRKKVGISAKVKPDEDSPTQDVDVIEALTDEDSDVIRPAEAALSGWRLMLNRLLTTRLSIQPTLAENIAREVPELPDELASDLQFLKENDLTRRAGLDILKQTVEYFDIDGQALVVAGLLRSFFESRLHLPPRFAQVLSRLTRNIELSDALPCFEDPSVLSLCELAKSWAASLGAAALNEISSAFCEMLHEMVMKHIENQRLQEAANAAIADFKLKQADMQAVVQGGLGEVLKRLRGMSGEFAGCALDELAPKLQKNMERGVEVAMKAEEVVEGTQGIIDLVMETSVAAEICDAVLDGFEAIPGAQNLVKLIRKLYNAAKGAQNRKRECEEFIKRVRYFERLLDKAQSGDMKDDIQESITRVENIIEQAIEFVERLQGRGFFRRVLNFSRDERRLQDLAADLSEAVQLMMIDVSLSSRVKRDLDPQELRGAADEDWRKNEDVKRQLIPLIEVSGEDLSEQLVDTVMAEQVAVEQVGDIDVESIIRNTLQTELMDAGHRQQMLQEELLVELREQQQKFSATLMYQIQTMLKGEEQLRPETIVELADEVDQVDLPVSVRRKLRSCVEKVNRDAGFQKLEKEKEQVEASLLERQRSSARKDAKLKEQQAEIDRLRDQKSVDTPETPADDKIRRGEVITRTPRGNTVFHANVHETGKAVVGKKHMSKHSAKQEARWLKHISIKYPDNNFVVGYEGITGFIVLLERADESLDKHIEHDEQIDDVVVKMWLQKMLKILEFLHSHKIAHNDIKLGNLLVFQKPLRLKVADFDTAAKFNEVRKKIVTPFICPPEVARYIRGESSFQDEGAVVDDKADIWAFGVTALHLISGEQPFKVDKADDLPGKLASIARLNQPDVDRKIRAIGQGNKQLKRFLKSCLQIDPIERQSARKLLRRGYISGDNTTQALVDRDHKSDRVLEKINIIHETQLDLKAGITNLEARIEAVRHTVINLQQALVPCIFTVEMVIDSTRQPDTTQTRSRLGRFFQMLDPRKSLGAVKKAIDDLKGHQLKLHLLCQYTYEPVGHGYLIRAPKETLPVRPRSIAYSFCALKYLLTIKGMLQKLMPLLSFGLRMLKTVNGIASVARFILGTPKFPNEFLDEAEGLLSQLPKDLQKFDCVEEAVGETKIYAEGANAPSPTELTAFQQYQFKQFLQEAEEKRKDQPGVHWTNHLTKVSLVSGEVLWVSEEGQRKLQEQQELAPIDTYPRPPRLASQGP